MRPMSPTLLALLFVVGSLAAAAPMAAERLHAHLKKADPGVNDTVPVAPKAIRLWFSEPVEVALTGVQVTGPSGPAAVGDPTQASAEDAPVVFPTSGALPAGVYTVNWHTVARDGHPSKGSYKFVVGPK